MPSPESRASRGAERGGDPEPQGPGPRDDATVARGERGGLRLWGPSTWIGIVLGVGLLGWLFSQVDWPQVGEAIRGADLGLILIGAACHYLTYPIRGWRWKRVLRHLKPKASSQRFGLFVFFYNAVDNLVPGKLGDLYAAHLVRVNLGMRRSTALGSIVFLRMIDAWVVLGLALASSFLLFHDRLPDSVVYALLAGALIASLATIALGTFFLWKKRMPTWLPEAVVERIQAFQEGMWPGRRQYLPIAGLTVLIWALEIAFLALLAQAFAIELTPLQWIFLASIPLLASAVPLTPSGVGFVELSLVGCLSALGVAMPLAQALTVVNRLLDYWLHLVLGLGVWVLRGPLGLRTWREADAVLEPRPRRQDVHELSEGGPRDEEPATGPTHPPARSTVPTTSRSQP